MHDTQTAETDGDRIRRLMKAWTDRTGLSQAAFAKQHQMPGGSSMISQHKSNHRPIALDHARAYMSGLGCQLSDISPTLAASIDNIETLSHSDATTRHVSDTQATTWPAATQIKRPPPTLAQCIEVLALHLNHVQPHDKDAAKSFLSALVASPATHATVASGLEQLCSTRTANTAAA